jgi:hypothetical protein
MTQNFNSSAFLPVYTPLHAGTCTLCSSIVHAFSSVGAA